MKTTLVAVACLVLLTSAPAQQKQDASSSAPDPAVLEKKVRKAWEDFKMKNKDGFVAVLADGFREAEEDGNGLGDRKAILEMIDGFELKTYTLKDFTVKPIGRDGALVTYLAHYEGSADGQPLLANTVYGEVWVHQGHDWKLLYVQETKTK